MSRYSSHWGDFWRYRTPAKKAPPKHGIAVKKIGTTWWGRRWIEALERISHGWSNRLARGKSYARGGRVHDLELVRGLVRARVTGTRVYKVEIRIPALSEPVWSKATAAMARQAAFTAKLLAGSMPEEIDEAFAAAGTSLFPRKESDLETDCSCPDWANPCKHVAAVHYVLGEAFDRDPFLLFELRGRKKDEVLAALRSARAGDGPTVPQRSKSRSRRAASESESGADHARAAAVIPSVALDTSEADIYERPRARLDTLRFRIETPPSHALVLRQLGVPSSWSHDQSLLDFLAATYESAGALAREMALGPPRPDPPQARGTLPRGALRVSRRA